jgi:predicted ribosome quality control (RQC) complex YloA/Tae2 family protein
MDIFVVKAVVDELQHHLPGATVSKVFQMSRDDVLLRLWRGRELRLLLSTHPTLQRLHLTAHRFDNPPRPPRFAAFLRAALQGVRVHNITVQPYDRVVSLSWVRPGESVPAMTLVHELTGPHANMVLVDAAGVILDALKHVPLDAKHSRSILPGESYVPPAQPLQRLRVSTVTPAHLQELFAQGMLDSTHLQRLLIGVSAELAAALLSHSQGAPQQCWELLQQLRQSYDSATLAVSISTTPDGAQHLSVLPLATPGTTVAHFASAQEAVAAFYEPAMLQTLQDGLQREVQTTLRQRLQKLQKKMHNLQQDYEKLQSYLPYQHYGTLLVAQRIPRGATQATVVDYYSPEQPTRTIALDPRLSGQENAQAYFKKYRKAKNGLEKVQALFQQCASEADRLARLAQQAEQATDWQTLGTLAEEIAGEPVPMTPPSRGTARQRPAVAQPYRTLVSSDGYTLYCGKSDAGNDAILRQVAAPHDVWLHAHQHAGAHVLVKIPPQQEVPRRTLLEAAAVAAYYSKGKHAAAVEVIYTQARYVQKFRGARPGQVQVRQYRTLQVAPRLPGR